MAVIAPPPLKTSLNFWGPGNSTINRTASPGPMTDVMSYQYPPPPPNGAEMDLPQHSGYLPHYAVPHAQGGMDMKPDLDAKDPLSKTMRLKRSISTPSVRPPQQSTTPIQQVSQQQQQQQQPPPGSLDAAALALAGEKRRNKLGYHRTSVACGHCRRRKIRCIPSPNDPQGRCINCIRLKKECSFYPVDQQPPQDTRQKSAARSSVGPKMGSASSSPATQTGLPPDMHGQPTYPHLAMPSLQGMAPPALKPSNSENYPPEAGKMPSSAPPNRHFEYGGHSGMNNWMSPDGSSASSKSGDPTATWRSYPSESPITPAFSPYAGHGAPPPATWTAPGASDSTQREEIAWQPYSAPPRSLSFGAESMTSHPHQYSSLSERQFQRKAGSMSADMYPPPIATTIPGIETLPGTTLDQQVSLSAGAVPPPTFGTWQSGYAYPKTSDPYGGQWYGESSSQQSEHGGNEHHHHQQPPATSMYYAER